MITISLFYCCEKAYPYEHMDDLEKFNETSFAEKCFYSHLNMEGITDADYAHTKSL